MAKGNGGEKPLDRGTQEQITRKIDKVVKDTPTPRPSREHDKES